MVVTGTVNDVEKNFTCDVTGLDTFKGAAETATTKAVLKFSSEDGDVFWIKAFDATGLDASSFGTAAFKDDYLAMLIAAKFSGVATISAKTLAQLATAVES